jgi:site-specific DNA-methyltransferase (adenine-specific)
MQIVPITQVVPNTSNPRIIKDDKFKKLVKSIQEFPEMLKPRPIVVDADMVVLGGNMRLKACKAAGLTEVPIVIADQLTPEQQAEFIIKDNVGFGEWDWDLLANEWDEQLLQDWGLELPFDNTPILEAEEDDYEAPSEIKTDIVLGDLIEIGNHRLLCGDSTDSDAVARLMDGQKADMVFTDPPYNVAYEGKTKDALTIKNDKMSIKDFSEFLSSIFNVLYLNSKEGSPIYVFGPIEDGTFLNAFNESGFKLQSILIWLKNTIVLGRKDYHYKHEPILYGWKEGAAHKWYGDRDKQTVFECNKPPRNGEHPTMKPIELCEFYINNSSQNNNIIIDSFLGSGSTMVAAHQLNRKCFGMELDPKYCQVIVDRMHKLDPSLEIKINGKLYGQD